MFIRLLAEAAPVEVQDVVELSTGFPPAVITMGEAIAVVVGITFGIKIIELILPVLRQMVWAVMHAD